MVFPEQQNYCSLHLERVKKLFSDIHLFAFQAILIVVPNGILCIISNYTSFIKPALISRYGHLGTKLHNRQSITHTVFDILPPHKVAMATVLANNCLFPHPADIEIKSKNKIPRKSKRMLFDKNKKRVLYYFGINKTNSFLYCGSFKSLK